ncbi:nitroreductase family protein [Desulfohalovibrio reitneri]|uniref:nitroreductase family protein n=1 Tax=Desulfohalovibrio reitneri TaxID=1307759 RepID=UPI0004A72A6C|nr:nitroreductase family protein [Desulfohalovibrio reitneri]
MVDFSIDKESCTQCGLCIQDCFPGVIQFGEDQFPELVNEGKCIRCQHCLAICPTGAVSILGREPEDSVALKGNLPEPSELDTLIRGRRSVRFYKDEDVDPQLLRGVLDTTWHAPTGVNAQAVQLTVINSRDVVADLSRRVHADLETALADEETSKSPVGRYLGWALKSYTRNGVDILFRGAPGVLVASAPKDTPCPTQDCIISLTTFDLVAQANGLGTMWDGLLTWAVDGFLPQLRSELDIPDDHQIGYAMLFGTPKVKYARTVQRGPANIAWPKG